MSQAIEELVAPASLEAAAQAGDRRRFAELAEAIDWANRSPGELARAIDLALQLELAKLAITLAQLGGRLFPDHERLQRAARVLAPAVVRAVSAPPIRNLNLSRDWLRDHARGYRGQWIAVSEGQLLGAAESLKELIALIGSDRDLDNAIITKVL